MSTSGLERSEAHSVSNFTFFSNENYVQNKNMISTEFIIANFREIFQN